MPNLTPFEIALLVLGAVLVTVLAAILWWHLAGDRVKALIAGWMALPLFWRLVLPVVFGAFVLHGSVKRGEGVGEGEGGEDFNRVEQVERTEGDVVGDSCSGRKEGGNSSLQLQLKTTTSQIVERVELENWHRNGAWKYKDEKIRFKHGFVFPFSTTSRHTGWEALIPPLPMIGLGAGVLAIGSILIRSILSLDFWLRGIMRMGLGIAALWITMVGL